MSEQNTGPQEREDQALRELLSASADRTPAIHPEHRASMLTALLAENLFDICHQ